MNVPDKVVAMAIELGGEGPQAPAAAPRYDVLLDPFGNYVVWDCRLDLPAMRGEEFRHSRSEREAICMAERLNAGDEA